MDMEKLVARLSLKEGNKQFAYDDATGKPLKKGDTVEGNITIGRGRNLSAKGISDEESATLLRNDINDALKDSSRQSWWPIVVNDDVRARAMVEILFNLGLPRLNGFHKMLAALQRSAFANASAEYINSHVPSEIGQRAYEIAYMLKEGRDFQA